MSGHIGSYLRNNGLATKVSIREKIEEYRIRNNKKPLIVIDLMYYDQLGGYLSSATAVKMNDLCGISRTRLQQLESFVATMKRWGAELIFITNGPYMDTIGQIVPDEDDAKGNSKDWRYDLQCAIVDYLGEAHYSRVAADARFIPIERIWTESIYKIARKNGKILWAWDNTRHQEIAKYANVHDALAVISKNYALLMYSGLAFPRYKLWSLVDCCSEKMVTIEFDPLAVRRTLRLSVKQVRLLGALSDRYFGTATFEGFLERTKISSSYRFVFGNLAEYVRKTAGNLQELDYLKIARDLFGEQKYIEKFDEFKAVCESYNVNNITLSLDQQNDAVSMQLKKQDSFSYDIFHGIKFTCSITFIDYRYWQQCGVDICEVVMSLYRRISGVILQHKKDPTLVRYINIKTSHSSGYTVEELHPEYPQDLCVPSLDHMFALAGQAVNTIPEFYISLLSFTTGMPFSSTMLDFFCKTDQRSQLQDSVTLRFMVTLNMLDQFEADIFLLAIHKCRRDQDANAVLPDDLHIRAFHLYFGYIKVRTLVKHCLYTAGFDDSFMDECYLDGIVFQTMYQKWDSIGETEEFRQEIDSLRNYRLH